MCSVCGRIAEELPLSAREWTCECGAVQPHLDGNTTPITLYGLFGHIQFNNWQPLKFPRNCRVSRAAQMPGCGSHRILCRSAVQQNSLTDEPLTYSIEDQLSGIVQVQFLQNMTAVRLDRVGADIESGGHFLVGFPLRDKLQDFSLATR